MLEVKGHPVTLSPFHPTTHSTLSLSFDTQGIHIREEKQNTHACCVLNIDRPLNIFLALLLACAPIIYTSKSSFLLLSLRGIQEVHNAHVDIHIYRYICIHVYVCKYRLYLLHRERASEKKT